MSPYLTHAENSDLQTPKNGLSRHSSSLLLYKKVRFEGKKSKVQNTTFQYHIPYHSERINKWYKYRYYTGKASSLTG